MNNKYFTAIRKDVLDNNELSLNAKGLYCLICYDLTKSLRERLLNPSIREETIESAKELEKFNYAHFYGLEEVKDSKSYIGLNISYQPDELFKEKIDKSYENIK